MAVSQHITKRRIGTTMHAYFIKPSGFSRQITFSDGTVRHSHDMHQFPAILLYDHTENTWQLREFVRDSDATHYWAAITAHIAGNALYQFTPENLASIEETYHRLRDEIAELAATQVSIARVSQTMAQRLDHVHQHDLQNAEELPF